MQTEHVQHKDMMSWLARHAIESRRGVYVIYHNQLLMAETPFDLYQLLQLVW